MKKEVEKKAAFNGDLSEEQLSVQIRQLILTAKEINCNELQLVEKISEYWNKVKQPDKKVEKNIEGKSQTEKKTEVLSKDEQNFASKLTKFLEYYQKDILYTDTEYWKDNFQVYNTSESFNNRLANEKVMQKVIGDNFNILLSMFILFNRKQAINQKNINCIVKHTLKYKYRPEFSDISISPLYIFFFNKLYFQSETDLPIFSKNDHIVCIGTSIVNRSGFKEFEKSNSGYFRKTKSREVAIAAIWFINNYF